MFTLPTFVLMVALRFLLLLVSTTPPVGAVPTPDSSSPSAGSDYWVADIKRQGAIPFGTDSAYQLYRNVKDFGAKGDGTTDDTAAINNAIQAGNRCGQGCDSSTLTPAIVYFPSGTYLVKTPIIQYYYTQFIGDATNLPTIKADPGFKGMAVIDSDPYDDRGANWYTNQNNFYRQIRNFVIDLTAMPADQGAGIHWQVAQATSLQNIRFEMVQGGSNNKQSGIFMDNGSGGFMSDLTFNGGNYGAFLGSQQFTTRNMTFNNCNTAIFMNWNWLWTLKSLQINNCGVGIDMANGGLNQTVGSVLLQDSTFTNTPKGVLTSYGNGSNPPTGGTLVIDNVDFSGCKAAVISPAGTVVLAGGSKVASWAQGHVYTTGTVADAPNATTTCAVTAATSANVQGPLTAPSKPASLLGSTGAVFERSKPQYETVPASSFVSVKSAGAKGDGTTDDTAAIQAVLDAATPSQVVYFDHGAYLISNTIKVPKNVKITGEMWPLLMASGSAFSDQAKPTPMFQVGQPGDTGSVELSDLIFSTKGAQPGAILIEWNLASNTQGSSGMWDVHTRIGGSAGTGLQSDKCAKNPSVTAPANPACMGAFLLLHITSGASAYVENAWFWVADHELDLADHGQINVYNGRGVLIESADDAQPVWLYGTAAEHSQLYNYQLRAAKNVYLAAIQTESPYMQSNPDALTPFVPNAAFTDPTFGNCGGRGSCAKAWGLRVIESSDVFVYGAGLYSFFDNYAQECLATESCQEHMVDVEAAEGEAGVWVFGLSTKASTSMVSSGGVGLVPQGDNRSNFCSTVAGFELV